jgi:hypothetical protein
VGSAPSSSRTGERLIAVTVVFSSLLLSVSLLKDWSDRSIQIASGWEIFCAMSDMRMPTTPLFVPVEQETEFRARFCSLSADDSTRPEVEIVESTFFDGDPTPWREQKSYKQCLDVTIEKLSTTVLHKTPKVDKDSQPRLSVSGPMDIVAGESSKKSGSLTAEEIDFARESS